jgi:hypothetical protein
MRSEGSVQRKEQALLAAAAAICSSFFSSDSFAAQLAINPHSCDFSAYNRYGTVKSANTLL